MARSRLSRPRSSLRLRKLAPLFAALVMSWNARNAASQQTPVITATAPDTASTQGNSGKISGLGVIDTVISPAPEPVYRADGYTIRIVASTETGFHDGLNSGAG